MPTTFVTGASGFVGALVVDQLLAQNHQVIAAFRSQSSADKLLSVHPEWDQSRITVTLIPDFSKSDAFDPVFQEHPEIEYIIHVAAPLGTSLDWYEHFEKPTIQGQVVLLQAVHQYGKNVKSIAVTGSINAITTGADDDVRSRVLDSTQWLPLSREDAIASQNPYVMYFVSKKLAEEAIWSFIKDNSPSFSVTVFNPCLLFGRQLQYIQSVDQPSLSVGLVYSVINSGKSETGTVPNTVFPGWVSVRDVVDLHIASLTNEKARNRRFVMGFPIKFDEIAAELRNIEGMEGRIGKNSGEERVRPTYDISEAEEVFGMKGKWRSLKEELEEIVKQYLELEGRKQ